MDKLGIQLVNKLQQKKLPTFTRPRIQIKAIQSISWMRMKQARNHHHTLSSLLRVVIMITRRMQLQIQQQMQMHKTPSLSKGHKIRMSSKLQFKRIICRTLVEEENAVQEELLLGPQSKKGKEQSSHHVPTPTLEVLSQHDQTFDSTHVSMKPINQVNLRQYVEGIQLLYEKDSFVTETSRPKWEIYKER